MSPPRRLLSFSSCLAITVGLCSVAFAGGARAPAVAPAPYFVKTAASLAEVEKTLQGQGAHTSDLLKPGATALEIVWRHEEDQEQKELEVHDGKDHVFFVTEGKAIFTLGGQLVAPHEISAGEWRAGQSQHSEKVEAGKGDLIFIPHGTVHGRSVKGRRFTMLQLSFWPGGAPVTPQASASAPAASPPAADPATAPSRPTRPLPMAPPSSGFTPAPGKAASAK